MVVHRFGRRFGFPFDTNRSLTIWYTTYLNEIDSLNQTSKINFCSSLYTPSPSFSYLNASSFLYSTLVLNQQLFYFVRTIFSYFVLFIKIIQCLNVEELCSVPTKNENLKIIHRFYAFVPYSWKKKWYKNEPYTKIGKYTQLLMIENACYAF